MNSSSEDAVTDIVLGADVLPIESWGVPERRIQIPSDIRDAICARTNILRVARIVDDKIRRKHRSSIEL